MQEIEIWGVWAQLTMLALWRLVFQQPLFSSMETTKKGGIGMMNQARFMEVEKGVKMVAKNELNFLSFWV